MGLLAAQPAVAQPASAPSFDQRLRQARQLLDTAPELAARLATQALAQAEREANQPGRLRCLNVLATASANANDPAAALRYDYQRLALAQQLGDSSTAAMACNNLASTLIERRDSAQAAVILRQGQALVPHGPAGNDARGTLLNSVATMSFNAGFYGQAIFEARQALRLLGPRPDSAAGAVVSSLRGLLGASYANLGQPERAEQLLSEQLAQDRLNHDGRQVAQNLVGLASSLLGRDQPAGLDTLRAALALARRLDAPPRVLECYEEFEKYYRRRGNFRQAYEWSQRVRQLDDSISSGRQRQALVAANAYYATQARDLQIKTLDEYARLQRSRSRLLLNVVAALTLALVAAGVLLRKLRRRDHQLAQQQLALRRATREAQRQAAANDRLYALVAHDLRGPVAAFASLSQLIDLYVQQQDRAGLSQLNGLVRQSARQLNELLHNLLGWTQTQTGELPFQPRQLPLAPVLAELQQLFAGQALARQVSLRVELPPPELSAWADPQLLLTILRNLVGNALRYAAPGSGLVTVRATTEPAAPNSAPDPASNHASDLIPNSAATNGSPTVVCVSVVDNGSGLDAAYIVALLEADQLGIAPPPPRPDDMRAGTGLGLAVCLAFARQHGGQLRVQSQPDQGTRLDVLLPVSYEL